MSSGLISSVCTSVMVFFVATRGDAMLHSESSEKLDQCGASTSGSNGVPPVIPGYSYSEVEIEGHVFHVIQGLIGKEQQTPRLVSLLKGKKSSLAGRAARLESRKHQKIKSKKHELEAELEKLLSRSGCSERSILEQYYEETRNKVDRLLCERDVPEIEVRATLSHLRDVAERLGLTNPNTTDSAGDTGSHEDTDSL